MGEIDKKTILVVEDEPDVQLYLQTVLEEAGFDVVTADNGKQALDRIKERRPDLISLDLEMPKMRGVKLLEYLQRNPEWAKIPFIIVTSHMRDEIGRRDIEEMKAKKIMMGPHTFIEKPIEPAQYIKRIREALHVKEEDEEAILDEEGALKREIIRRLDGATKEELEKILAVLGRRQPLEEVS